MIRSARASRTVWSTSARSALSMTLPEAKYLASSMSAQREESSESSSSASSSGVAHWSWPRSSWLPVSLEDNWKGTPSVGTPLTWTPSVAPLLR